MGKMKQQGEQLAVDLGYSEGDLQLPEVIAKHTEFWRSAFGDAYLFGPEKEEKDGK